MFLASARFGVLALADALSYLPIPGRSPQPPESKVDDDDQPHHVLEDKRTLHSSEIATEMESANVGIFRGVL